MQFYETEYRASSQWPYAILAGCVVYRKTLAGLEVLLLKRAAGDFPELKDGSIDSYHLPKGHVIFNESLEQTALRETAEEAGCEVVLKTYLGSKLNKYEDHRGIMQSKTIHYFAGEWKHDLKEKDNEHSERLWSSFNEAIKLIGTSNPKKEYEILERLYRFLELTNAG